MRKAVYGVADDQKRRLWSQWLLLNLKSLLTLRQFGCRHRLIYSNNS